MVTFSLAIRFTAFAIAGVLWQPQLLPAIALFLPAAGVGLWLGHRIHVAASRETVLRILFSVLIASGLSLLVRAVLSLRA